MSKSTYGLMVYILSNKSLLNEVSTVSAFLQENTSGARVPSARPLEKAEFLGVKMHVRRCFVSPLKMLYCSRLSLKIQVSLNITQYFNKKMKNITVSFYNKNYSLLTIFLMLCFINFVVCIFTEYLFSNKVFVLK